MLEGQGSPKISLTSTITSQDLGFGLILTDTKRMYLVFFASVLGGAFLSIVAAGKIDETFAPPLSTVLYFLVGVAVAFYLYSEAVMCLDTATITVTREKIEVIRGPIPPWKNLVIETGHISQVFHKQRIVKLTARTTLSHGRSKSPFYLRYVLGVVTTDGARIDLLKDIASERDAEALEKEIERWLGIADRPVEGELKTIFAAKGFLTRLTQSPSSGTILGSPLFFFILGAAFVTWTILDLLSGQVRVGGRYSHAMVSFADDPATYSLNVSVLVGIAGACFYVGGKNFSKSS